MVRVATDQQIAEPVQYQTHRAQHENVGREVHRILMMDVRQRLKCLDDCGKAERRHENAHHQHREDVDARPAERVLQRAFARLSRFHLHILLDLQGRLLNLAGILRAALAAVIGRLLAG